jgi:hypothetical protein
LAIEMNLRNAGQTSAWPEVISSPQYAQEDLRECHFFGNDKANRVRLSQLIVLFRGNIRILCYLAVIRWRVILVGKPAR